MSCCISDKYSTSHHIRLGVVALALQYVFGSDCTVSCICSSLGVALLLLPFHSLPVTVQIEWYNVLQCTSCIIQKQKFVAYYVHVLFSGKQSDSTFCNTDLHLNSTSFHFTPSTCNVHFHSSQQCSFQSIISLFFTPSLTIVCCSMLQLYSTNCTTSVHLPAQKQTTATFPVAFSANQF